MVYNLTTNGLAPKITFGTFVDDIMIPEPNSISSATDFIRNKAQFANCIKKFKGFA